MKCVKCEKTLTKKQKKYCSRECQHSSYQEIFNDKSLDVEFACDNCKRIFFRKSYKIRGKLNYCSRKCSNEHKTITMIGNKNCCHSEDWKKKQSTYMKERWLDRNFRLKTTLILRECSKKSWSEKSRRKRILTMLKRHNADHSFKMKITRKNCNSPESHQKRHQTMKLNRTYGKSKIEDKFYEILCERFSKEDIERQVRVHKWNIDFYIKSNNTYIQFDGIYWHGLDRPIEIIKEFKSNRDRIIYKTYLRDQEQNKWFKENNLQILRIRDDNSLIFAVKDIS